MNKAVYKPLAFIATLAFSLNLTTFFQPVNATADTDDNSKPIIVVSMGDSYSSGEGIEPFYGQIDDKGNDLPRSEKILSDDWVAHRSMYSWPSMLKVGDKAVREHKMPLNKSNGDSEMQWYFVAASGAVTNHFDNPYPHTIKTLTLNWRDISFIDDSRDLPRQFEVFEDNHLTGEVDYVTMSIGGNDLGFVNLCSTAAADSWSWINPGTTFQNPNLLNNLVVMTNANWLNEIRDNLKEAYLATYYKAGKQADIIVAGYPELYYRDTSTAVAGKQQRKMLDDLVLKYCESKEESKDGKGGEIQKLIDEVNAEIRKENPDITRDKVHYVSVITEFENQGMDAWPYHEGWINGINLNGSEVNDQSNIGDRAYASAHPNKTGAEHYAKLVNEKIEELEKIKKAERETSQTSEYSESELKSAVEKTSGARIGAWAYADYDKDGNKEAFAVVTENEKNTTTGSYKVKAVYYVNNKAETKIMDNSLDWMLYEDSNARYLEAENHGFFNANMGAHGSGFTTILYSVKNGVPYELKLSQNIQGFYKDGNGFYTTENDFSNGYHEYPEVELIYDSDSKEFSKGARRGKQDDNVVYLEDMPIIESDQYADNEGDSFVYKIGEHRYTRGNTDIDGVSYTHGLEAWIARWNYTAESSWAYSVFDLGGKYSSLSGKGVLIKSYNTTNFDTTLEFIGDGKLIKSYHLTPDSIPFDIDVNVSGVKQLKVYAYDNKAVSGGTSFGLTGMVLTKKADNTDDNNTAIFAELPDNFTFTSGVGGWATGITIDDDGTFTGSYHASAMGSTGDGYPNGTVYISNFTGHFTNVKKIDDYSYSMKLGSLDVEGTSGESYIENGTKYIYADPYGLDDADEFMIYLPGISMSALPEEFVSWSHVSTDVRNTLPSDVFGIYNVGGKQGFVGEKDDSFWRNDYRYTYGNAYSELQPSYSGYTHLTFWPQENTAATLNINFKWTDDNQTTFVGTDSRGSGDYQITISANADKTVAKVTITSLDGSDLSLYGGTSTGTLSAGYNIIVS